MLHKWIIYFFDNENPLTQHNKKNLKHGFMKNELKFLIIINIPPKLAINQPKISRA